MGMITTHCNNTSPGLVLYFLLESLSVCVWQATCLEETRGPWTRIRSPLTSWRLGGLPTCGAQPPSLVEGGPVLTWQGWCEGGIKCEAQPDRATGQHSDVCPPSPWVYLISCDSMVLLTRQLIIPSVPFMTKGCLFLKAPGAQEGACALTCLLHAAPARFLLSPLQGDRCNPPPLAGCPTLPAGLKGTRHGLPASHPRRLLCRGHRPLGWAGAVAAAPTSLATPIPLVLRQGLAQRLAVRPGMLLAGSSHVTDCGAHPQPSALSPYPQPPALSPQPSTLSLEPLTLSPHSLSLAAVSLRIPESFQAGTPEVSEESGHGEPQLVLNLSNKTVLPCTPQTGSDPHTWMGRGTGAPGGSQASLGPWGHCPVPWEVGGGREGKFSWGL